MKQGLRKVLCVLMVFVMVAGLLPATAETGEDLPLANVLFDECLVEVTSPAGLEVAPFDAPVEVQSLPQGAVVTTGGFVAGECGTPGAQWRLYDCGTVVVGAGFINWTSNTQNPWNTHRENIYNIAFTGSITAGTNLTFLFGRLPNVQRIEGLCYFDTSNVTSMSFMFSGVSSLTKLDVSGWDTGNVTHMGFMFSEASGLTELDVSGWDTRNVTHMPNIFSGASGLTELDLSGWDTRNVTNMMYMFSRASGLTELDLSGWDTGNVRFMLGMFSNASGLTELDLSGWDTGNVTNMADMFWDASGLIELDLSGWDTGNVTNMDGMFSGASGLTELDVSGWDTGNVTDMRRMFRETSSLTELDVSGWDTGNVAHMRWMFDGASSLTELDVSGWDTGNVTDMWEMFSGASGLTELDLSGWDVGNVTNMWDMFSGASGLTKLDVSGWDTGNVISMHHMFYGASSLTELDLSGWDTGNVVDMWGMFSGASSLRHLALGENFRVPENVSAHPYLPAVPANATYTGYWQNVGTGTPDNPTGEHVFTSRQLVEFYRTAPPNLADTWVWQRNYLPYCDNYGEYPCNCPDPDAIITISTAFADPGDTVSVSVRISENPGFASMFMRINFPSELTLLSAALAKDICPLNFETPYDFTVVENYVYIGWAGRTENITESGTLFTLTFVVCPLMDTNRRLPITAVFKNAFDGYDTPTTADNEELYFRIVPGEVRVQPTRMGDMDGNGRVTSADATLLARYLVGHYVTIDTRAADVNCDGVVTTDDIIRLARALAGHFPTLCPYDVCDLCR